MWHDYLPPLSHTTGAAEEQPRNEALDTRWLQFGDSQRHGVQALDAPSWIPTGSTVLYSGRHVAFGSAHALRPGFRALELVSHA